MENVNKKELKLTKKHVIFIVVNIIGLFIFLLGGVELLAYISIAIVFFVLGKYTEKAISFVKDYRLQMKVNRMDITYKEVQRIKEENEFLKEMIKNDNSSKESKSKIKSFNIEDLEIS